MSVFRSSPALADLLHMVLARLRVPLTLLIAVYGISIFGLTLMPGTTPDGQPWRMSYFHAFYVMTYTATTIGYGEVPYAFSDAQRAWMTVAIYLSVIGWTYALGTVFAMLSDPAFRLAVQRSVFRWRVDGLGEPFYIVAGCGQSGLILAKALDRMGLRVVMIDNDEDRSLRVALIEFQSPVMVLRADARWPMVLADAGIHKPECRGVVALTASDSINEAVAIGSRVLRGDIRVIARVSDGLAEGNLEAFGSISVINPNKGFATNVGLDLRAPVVLQLEDWLTAAPGSPCPERMNLHPGPWLLVGFGRFGQAIAQTLDDHHVEWHALDPKDTLAREARVLRGDNSETSLKAAGVEKAAVLVAGTDDDAVNLAITLLARRINPKLQCIVRQNNAADRVLIDAAKPDLRYAQSDLVVRECLQILNTPLLNQFLMELRKRRPEEGERVFNTLTVSLGLSAPHLWAFDVDIMQPGLFRACLQHLHDPLRLVHLMTDPEDRDKRLEVVALMVKRKRELRFLPPDDFALMPGDRILFAGRNSARRAQWLFRDLPQALVWVRTGREEPQTWLFRRLHSINNRRLAARRARRHGPDDPGQRPGA